MTTLADVDEAEALRNTQDAMSIVGLSAAEQVGLHAMSCNDEGMHAQVRWPPRNGEGAVFEPCQLAQGLTWESLHPGCEMLLT